jgi:hypothetical protein
MEPSSTSIIENEQDQQSLEAAAAQKAAATARIKQILKISIIIIISIILLAAIIILLIILIPALTKSSTTDTSKESPTSTPSANSTIIDGYQCETDTCFKAADLPDDKLLIRDTAYYIFTPADHKKLKTTIEEVSYRSITPFAWGDQTLIVLEQTTNKSGLYSITANRQLATYNYDSFHTDINDPIYSNMQWILGKYILAQNTPEIRLIDITDGKELIRATAKIFCFPAYFIGIETSGERRIYTPSGTRFLISPATDFLAIISGDILAQVPTAKSFTLYDSSGTKLQSSNPSYKSLQTSLQKSTDYPSTIKSLPGTQIIPN